MRKAACRAFLAQAQPLLDAEAVLLVDDHECEPREFDVLLEQRMRPDGEAVVARREPGERLAPRPRRHPPGEQQGLEPQRGEPAREILGVLFGEQLRRRHQRDLKTGFDGVRGRERGDDGLAGADVALHQPHHRVRHREVRAHFAKDALLRARSA